MRFGTLFVFCDPYNRQGPGTGTSKLSRSRWRKANNSNFVPPHEAQMLRSATMLIFEIQLSSRVRSVKYQVQMVIKALETYRVEIAYSLEISHSGYQLSKIAQVLQFMTVTYERHVARTARINISRTSKLQIIPISLPCASTRITPGTQSVKHNRVASVGEHPTKAS